MILSGKNLISLLGHPTASSKLALLYYSLMTEKIKVGAYEHDQRPQQEFHLFRQNHALLGGNLELLDEHLASGLISLDGESTKVGNPVPDKVLFETQARKFTGISFTGDDRIGDSLRTANYLSRRFLRNPLLRIGYVVPTEAVVNNPNNQMEVESQISVDSSAFKGLVFLLFPTLNPEKTQDLSFDNSRTLQQIQKSVQRAHEANTICEDFALVDQFGRQIVPKAA